MQTLLLIALFACGALAVNVPDGCSFHRFKRILTCDRLPESVPQLLVIFLRFFHPPEKKLTFFIRLLKGLSVVQCVNADDFALYKKELLKYNKIRTWEIDFCVC